MKVSELSGRALDYWVARAEGYEFIDIPPDANGENASRVLAPPGILKSGWTPAPLGKYGHMLEAWSSSWERGGPLIEREKIGVMRVGTEWKAWALLDMDATAVADTPLVAAMRAYVASKFGDEVEEPK
ncbi:phage protein NinX family protein [Caballeronia zhejiangensis]|uniref:phage protein NinX family protein n=1 Tax=Caballeronia zhejiangensis TaxID=871203 RepID=UPI00158CC123|nr:phage protein NinX family protein [Caballeronia zhejiangensis]